MNPKRILISLVALAAVVLLIDSFTDWFRAPHIQILAQVRPSRLQSRSDSLDITFTMDADYRLTRVQVVELSQGKTAGTNKVVWHLSAKSNVNPTRGFLYGETLPGLAPGPGPATPSPLQPGVAYRIIVEAGRYRGSTDFQTRPRGSE